MAKQMASQITGIRKNIPNSITLANLICGCFACVMAIKGAVLEASMLVIIGAIFDFFDGFAARLLHVHSALGKELDSLADMVSFGLAPSLVLFYYLENALLMHPQHPAWLSWSFVLLPVCAAIRLARFNLEESNAGSFTGLPSPASALAICSLPFLEADGEKRFNWFIENPYWLLLVVFFFSFMMISTISMLSLKFPTLKWKGNQPRFLFLACSLVSLSFGILSIPLIIFLYFLFSLTQNRFQ